MKDQKEEEEKKKKKKKKKKNKKMPKNEGTYNERHAISTPRTTRAINGKGEEGSEVEKAAFLVERHRRGVKRSPSLIGPRNQPKGSCGCHKGISTGRDGGRGVVQRLIGVGVPNQNFP